MAALVDLKPRKELLNPSFESYKLSLSPLATHQQDFEKAVDVSSLTDHQLTSHHTKLFAAPNHLTADPWADNSVYVVDSSWTVRNIFVQQNGKLDSGHRVFDIPDASEFRLIPGRVNVSLRFADQQFAFLTDGAGRLFLLNTGERTKHSSTQWKILLKEKVLKEDSVFSVVDAIYYINDSKQEVLECLLVSVEDAKEENQHTQHLTVITWITFTTEPDGKWSIRRTRRLEGPRPFDHVGLERGGGAVTVASNRPFTMTADSVKEVVLSSGSCGDWEMVGREPQHPLYTWSQTVEDISIQLTLPADTCKADVYVTLGVDQVEIGIKNSVTLLQGPLHARIDTSTGTWNIEGQKLEVSFMKEREEMWETLVVGDTRGEMTVDEATIKAIHDRLKHLTSEKWNPDPDLENRPYNTQQLEECDAFDDEDCIYLMRIDGETHKISHQATVSYNLLFNVNLDADKATALCFRHDVDGLLWQPVPINKVVTSGTSPVTACPWVHVGTLDAIGFVQASKTQRRFTSCAPDLSVAAIADCSRHIYLYRQHAPLATPLRNRRTSRDVSTVAKQHVVTLDPPDSIVGLHVSNSHVFVATASKIYAVTISQDD